MVFVAHHLAPTVESLKPARVLFLPPVAGLRRPLSSGFVRLAKFITSHGYGATVLEFAGQNGRPGAYSVKNSCDDLQRYLEETIEEANETILLFGICSGALAALHVAAFCPCIDGVFCWELSSFYQYSRESAMALSRIFDLRIDWDNVLTPIQPVELLSNISQPVAFGFSNLSGVTTIAEQTALADFTQRGSVVYVEEVGHFLRSGAGLENALGAKLISWSEACMTQSLSL